MSTLRSVVAGILAAFCVSSVTFADGGLEGADELEQKPAVVRNSVKEHNVSTEHVSRSSGLTIEHANNEQLATAVGHYARTRSLLIAAIHEFDKGYKLAKPDSLINSREWRNDIISRAEDLEKILAPQPRITEGGVKFDANSALLMEKGEAKKNK